MRSATAIVAAIAAASLLAVAHGPASERSETSRRGAGVEPRATKRRRHRAHAGVRGWR
jgi:hypothetical protein